MGLNSERSDLLESSSPYYLLATKGRRVEIVTFPTAFHQGPLATLGGGTMIGDVTAVVGSVTSPGDEDGGHCSHVAMGSSQWMARTSPLKTTL